MILYLIMKMDKDLAVNVSDNNRNWLCAQYVDEEDDLPRV